jgi:cytochrome c2
MKKFVSRRCRWIDLPGTAIVITCATLSWLIGCANTKQSTETAAGATPPAPEKAGAQLWVENCNRCHNIRSPGNYSPAQWEVVMMHMRARANLTPEEHKKILEFLKSGTGT